MKPFLNNKTTFRRKMWWQIWLGRAGRQLCVGDTRPIRQALSVQLGKKGADLPLRQVDSFSFAQCIFIIIMPVQQKEKPAQQMSWCHLCSHKTFIHQSKFLGLGKINVLYISSSGLVDLSEIFIFYFVLFPRKWLANERLTYTPAE